MMNMMPRRTPQMLKKSRLFVFTVFDTCKVRFDITILDRAYLLLFDVTRDWLKKLSVMRDLIEEPCTTTKRYRLEQPLWRHCVSEGGLQSLLLEIQGNVALNLAVDPVGQAVGVLQILVNSFARRIAKDKRSLSSQSERAFIAIHRLSIN